MLCFKKTKRKRKQSHRKLDVIIGLTSGAGLGFKDQDTAWDVQRICFEEERERTGRRKGRKDQSDTERRGPREEKER